MTTPNRRNHYRLLHVQPDAPAVVIRAAYRALIALHHPDKGGDATTAALLNAAYSVLGDETRRAAYDAARDAARAARAARASTPASARRATAVCPLCGAAVAARVTPQARCTRCQAPLAPPPSPDGTGKPDDRRGMPRVSKSDWARLRVGWPPRSIDVRLRDLSLDGISLYCGIAFPLGTPVRVTGDSIDVVAQVVTCRRSAEVFILHARLVSAEFTNPAGGFVSARA